jgi:hypothetical protein
MSGLSVVWKTVTAWAIALAAGLLGHEDTGYWRNRIAATSLHLGFEEVRQSSACAQLLPLDFVETYPVPVRDPAQERFSVLFLPAKIAADSCSMASPAFSGEFVLGTPAADACVSLEAAVIEPLGHCMPPGLSWLTVSRKEATLFESLGPVAALYRKGGGVGPEDRRRLRAYVDAFQTLVVPSLLPYYYRQNPDFWEWMQREGGRSIPRPAGPG